MTALVRTDAAQPAIVLALRKVGLPVRLTHMVGDGFPDLVTMHRLGYPVFIECKTGKGYTKPATKAKQEAFARDFPVSRCTTPEEALKAVGLLP